MRFLLFAHFLCLFFLSTVTTVLAQDSLSLSVTPTLFQIAVEPGQVWQSQVKVINSNNFPISIYAEAVNFEPRGEMGQGRFIPVFEEVTEGTTLAEWISLPDEQPIVIPALESYTIPITVHLPKEVAPGGHFAAIMVGTKPPETSDALMVKTSQVVTSLFFVRVAGDIVENGSIRTFTVQDRFVDIPKVDFELRFENKGNVHLQPQGHITIYNMWGKERGMIPINAQTHFGNVLPESIRNFQFTWETDASLTDIGRYKAVVGLAYGSESKQFVTSELYFWVIPVKPLLITLAVLGAVVLFVVWLVRLYVRRMLLLAGVDPYHKSESRIDIPEKIKEITLTKTQTQTVWYRSSIENWSSKISKLLQFKKYFDRKYVSGHVKSRWQLVFILTGILMVLIILIFYFGSVLKDESEFQVTIDNPDAALVLNSEEVVWHEIIKNENNLPAASDQSFDIQLVNTSGRQGTAARAALKLAHGGLFVKSLIRDESRSDERTVVLYPPSRQAEALAISRTLNNALLSSDQNRDSTGKSLITVYVGKDQISSESR